MARRRVSTTRLAEAADIPYGSLRRYLATERHIDVSVLSAICAAFGMDVAALIERAIEAGGLSDPAPSLRAVAAEQPLEDAGENSI